MGLYKDEETGATGAICNYDGTLQYRELFFTALDDYIRYGYMNNVPMKMPTKNVLFMWICHDVKTPGTG